MSEIKVSKEINEIKEKIKSLNLGQVSELIEGLKADYNIQETAVVQTTASAQSEEKVGEKAGNVSVELIKMKEGLSAIKVYGAIKETYKRLADEKLVEGEISIIQAQKLTKKEDKIIFENIPRKKAEDIQKYLAEEGVEVKIK